MQYIKDTVKNTKDITDGKTVTMHPWQQQKPVVIGAQIKEEEPGPSPLEEKTKKNPSKLIMHVMTTLILTNQPASHSTKYLEQHQSTVSQ